MRCLLITLIAFAFSTGAVADQNPAQTPRAQHSGSEPPAYLTANPSCAIFIGGLGSAFENNPGADKFWQEVNRELSSRLFSQLYAEGYQIKRITLSQHASKSTVEEQVSAALAVAQCNTFIQFVHIIGDDSEGSFFKFDVSLMYLEVDNVVSSDKPGTRTKTIGLFKKGYRFARTQSQMDSFKLSSFAELVYGDLSSSGVLKRILRAQ